MSKQFVKKNIKLSLEFGRYLSGNPALFTKIPNKSILIFTIKGDPYFNKSSRSLAESARTSKSKMVEVQKQGRKWEIFSPAVR